MQSPSDHQIWRNEYQRHSGCQEHFPRFAPRCQQCTGDGCLLQAGYPAPVEASYADTMVVGHGRNCRHSPPMYQSPDALCGVVHLIQISSEPLQFFTRLSEMHASEPEVRDR